MKITIKNIIKENKDIDPKQRYVNGIVNMIKPPYFNFLRVNEVPEELWKEILSKIFKQKVMIYNNGIYDSNNNLIYGENSNGNWAKKEYDENNNEIYYENSNGFWVKSEYDSNNNRIYYEDSNGEIVDNRPINPINENINPKEKYINGISKIIKPPYFYFLRVNEVPRELWNEILSKLFNHEVIISPKYNNRIHDSNNNEIYYEDSNGKWVKREFDENNNIIYYENSDGFWAKKEYDENNNELYFENSNGKWVKSEYDSNNNRIYYDDNDGYWVKKEYDENNNEIYYEDSFGNIMDNRPINPINENIDPKQRYVNGIVNMIRRPYMGFLIDNEVPEELWKEILSKIFNTNDIDWEKRIRDNKILYELIIQNEKGRQLYYETHDYWEQLIYGYHNRLDMDFTWYINSVGNKKVTFVGKHNTVVYSNGPTGYPWSGLSDDIKNNKFFDINY